MINVNLPAKLIITLQTQIFGYVFLAKLRAKNFANNLETRDIIIIIIVSIKIRATCSIILLLFAIIRSTVVFVIMVGKC